MGNVFLKYIWKYYSKNVFNQVMVTERAGHAHDVVSTLPDRELRSLDGIVTVVHEFMLSIII